MDETTAGDVRAAMREAAAAVLNNDAAHGSLAQDAHALAAGFRDLDTGTVTTANGLPAFTEDATARLAAFTARQPADAVKRDLELTCDPCGAAVCDIEDDDTLSVLAQAALSHQCHASAHPGPGELAAEAGRLDAEIRELTSTWNAATEVDTNLGADVETAGRSLALLCAQAADALGPADPDLAAQARQLSAGLGAAVTYYKNLEEHEFDASIDIFDRLDPAIALILHALQRVPPRTAPARGTPAAVPANARTASGHTAPSQDRNTAAALAAGKEPE